MISMIADAKISQTQQQRLMATLPIAGSGREIIPFDAPDLSMLSEFLRAQSRPGIIFIESCIGSAWHYLFKQHNLNVGIYRQTMSNVGKTRALREFEQGNCCALLAESAALPWQRYPEVDWIMHFDPPATIEDWITDIARIGRYGRPARIWIRTSAAGWTEGRRRIDEHFSVRIHPTQERWREEAYERLDQLRRITNDRPVDELAARIDEHFSQLLPDCVATKMALAVRTGHPCGWAARPVYGQVQSGLVAAEEVADLVARFRPALVGFTSHGGRNNRRIADQLVSVCEERGVPCLAWSERELYRAAVKKNRASEVDIVLASQDRWPDADKLTAVEVEARWLALITARTLVPPWSISERLWEPDVDVV